MSRQVKKLSDGSEEQSVKVSAKPKKAPKKPLEFKAGKWNPETELLTKAKAATDKARQAEWEFHNAVMAMKEAVRGHFGSDSDEAQAVGYKKKSEHKRPRRRAA